MIKLWTKLSSLPQCFYSPPSHISTSGQVQWFQEEYWGRESIRVPVWPFLQWEKKNPACLRAHKQLRHFITVLILIQSYKCHSCGKTEGMGGEGARGGPDESPRLSHAKHPEFTLTGHGNCADYEQRSWPCCWYVPFSDIQVLQQKTYSMWMHFLQTCF